METGNVLFFDVRDGKRFGFLVDEKGQELFFHYNDGRTFLLTVDGEVKMHSFPAQLSYPKQGDQLMFERGRNAKGEKAAPWGFRAAYDHLMKQAESCQARRELPQRRFANVFDLPIPGPEEIRDHGKNPDAIGGYEGISWWEYFKDAATGEVYRVRCWDGVNGGRGAYLDKDEVYRSAGYQVLQERFRAAARRGAREIRVSRNERFLMQGFTRAFFLESAEGLCDGKESNDGLEGGLVGHFRGIAVICDLELADNLSPRQVKAIPSISIRNC